MAFVIFFSLTAPFLLSTALCFSSRSPYLMDSLRFVHESPQINHTQKKRPRLVTSCDNCRLKKIKCVQTRSQDKCEACQAGNVSCEFRDRERYFAERSRIVSGGSTSSNSRQSSPHRAGTHDRSPSYAPMYGARRSPPGDSAWIHADSHSPAPLGHRYPSGPPSPYASSAPQSSSGTWYSPEGNDQRTSYFASTPLPAVGGTRSDYSPYTLPTGLPGDPPQNPSSSYRPRADFQSDHRSSSSALVDPRHTELPHPSLMSHFVQIFFEYLGRVFTFLQYDDITARLYSNTLAPALANGIAAHASRSILTVPRGGRPGSDSRCSHIYEQREAPRLAKLECLLPRHPARDHPYCARGEQGRRIRRVAPNRDEVRDEYGHGTRESRPRPERSRAGNLPAHLGGRREPAANARSVALIPNPRPVLVPILVRARGDSDAGRWLLIPQCRRGDDPWPIPSPALLPSLSHCRALGICHTTATRGRVFFFFEFHDRRSRGGRVGRSLAVSFFIAVFYLFCCCSLLVPPHLLRLSDGRRTRIAIDLSHVAHLYRYSH
ncbi:hypothetical protein OF83DRAFT_372228 [Amylostereum chailletii]|nr:hypothetical protein OF83DRAFT_372228 [Amylostereum chailletii]